MQKWRLRGAQECLRWHTLLSAVIKWRVMSIVKRPKKVLAMVIRRLMTIIRPQKMVFGTLIDALERGRFRCQSGSGKCCFVMEYY